MQHAYGLFPVNPQAKAARRDCVQLIRANRSREAWMSQERLGVCFPD